ncbi:MAG TPA: hypoxanthine phosphoribosyltransferase [Anaerolineae bacterium]|nr:hypoxanthine phosphoribosyltransferase [Anaerolineae bacterium]HPL28860.1 hypoxanthine phosphoribosyltransferase [Anaerolineae bacterium]
MPEPCPATPWPVEMQDLARVLIGAEELRERVCALGTQISGDYAGQDLLLVGVLRGVTIFIADLLRAITIPVTVDFIAISSYGPSLQTGGVVRLTKDLEEPIEGRHVLFVEDVIDTGLTLSYLLRTLRARGPASLRTCVLLDKRAHRLIDVDIAYHGFALHDEYVVGYGLDHRQRYRNLPVVGVLKPECY